MSPVLASRSWPTSSTACSRNRRRPTTPTFAPYIRSFVDAEAGLVNMRVAVAYATTRVPSIDPGRLFAVGHSSAATLALLVAENEPRIAACVAFAPVVDVKEHIPTQAQQALGQLVPGADQIFTRFNPRAGEEKLNCPVFVFVALDDQNAQPDRALVDRLTSLGKSAVLATVPNGGHYEPMIKSGIPQAIRWLKGIHRPADESVVAPKSAGPAPKARIPRVPRGGNSPTAPGIRRPRGDDVGVASTVVAVSRNGLYGLATGYSILGTHRRSRCLCL